jgi:hypothetical protein
MIPCPVVDETALARLRGDLWYSRMRFLYEFDLVEVFPALYSHATEAIVRQPLGAPKMILEMIERFHTLYVQGRTQRHWRPYYDYAAFLNAKRGRIVSPISVLELMTQGVNAHINVDLPRAITEVVQGRSEAEITRFVADYKRLDTVFAPAEKQMLSDLREAMRRRGIVFPEPRLLRPGICLWSALGGRGTSRDIRARRHRALVQALRASGYSPSLLPPDSP